MVQPFVKSPLGGNLGSRTVSFYRLDPTGTVPVEPLLDVVPALTANRVAMDMVDSENAQLNFTVTANALQDFTNAQSNIHQELERITFNGTMIGGIDVPLLGSVGLGGIPDVGGGLRTDLIRVRNLKFLAMRREPIMVVSPRVDLPKAFIEGVSVDWNPALGDNTIITITVVEARIVNPLIADAAIPDVGSSLTGNNSITEAGAQSGTPVDVQEIFEPTATGVAPSVVPG